MSEPRALSLRQQRSRRTALLSRPTVLSKDGSSAVAPERLRRAVLPQTRRKPKKRGQGNDLVIALTRRTSAANPKKAICCPQIRRASGITCMVPVMTPEESESADLLRRARGGDAQAKADLFARYRDRLRLMVRLRLD